MPDIDFMQPENRMKATPLLLLKQGLERGQWEAVSFAYLILTGDKIKPSASLLQIPDKNIDDEVVYNIGTSNQNEDENEVQQEEDIDEDNEDEDEHHKSKTFARKSKVDVHGKKNRYVDDGVLAKEDNIFLPKVELTEAQLHSHRPTHNLTRVTCFNCGKKEKVDPMLSPQKIDRNYKMRYYCNECSCRGARE